MFSSSRLVSSQNARDLGLWTIWTSSWIKIAKDRNHEHHYDHKDKSNTHHGFAHNDHEHHKNNHDRECDKSHKHHKTYHAQEWEKKPPQTSQVLYYN